MIANKLVLVSCCAPCSCGAIKELLAMKDAGFIGEFVVMFYNPNVFPESEHKKRLDHQIAFCEKVGAQWITEDWHHDAWLNAIKGLEDEPECGARCLECFKFRFEYAVEWAKKMGYDAVASVLGVSEHKSQTQVDAAAMLAIHDIGDGKVKYVPVGWDKDLHKKTLAEQNFYRQKYCGCEFSMRKNKI